MKDPLKNELSARIDNFCITSFNVYLDNSKKWRLEQILQEIYLWGYQRGKAAKCEEIKRVLSETSEHTPPATRD